MMEHEVATVSFESLLTSKSLIMRVISCNLASTCTHVHFTLGGLNQVYNVCSICFEKGKEKLFLKSK